MSGVTSVHRADSGHIRILTLARPASRNALDDEMLRALHAEVVDAGAGGVRALVVTGEGSAFCSGLDLRALAAASEGPMERHQRAARALGELFLALVTSPVPVVAAVQGPAVAGGAGLLLASDLAVMSDEATVAFTETRLGFVPALVATLLVRHVGEKGARDLLLRARPVDAATALRLGLVNEVVAPDGVRDRALALAEDLARNAPSAIATTKRLLASVRALALEDGLRLAAEVNAAARATDTLREGVAAFMARREPKWEP
jgi:methylglutaconyl-CoA hydratase